MRPSSGGGGPRGAAGVGVGKEHGTPSWCIPLGFQSWWELLCPGAPIFCWFVGFFFFLQEIDLFLIPFGSQGWMFPHVGHRVPWESGGSGCAAPGAAGDKGPGCSPSCSLLAGPPLATPCLSFPILVLQ